MADILTDLQAIAAGYSSYQKAGGIGPWLAHQLAAFGQLPASLQSLRAQAFALQKVFQGDTSTTPAASEDLQNAIALLDTVNQQYPTAQQQVNDLTITLLPVMPKMSMGIFDADVIEKLTANSPQILATVTVVNRMLVQRDDAAQLLQQAATNPSLPTSLRDKAMRALAGTSWGDLVKYGFIAAVGVLVLKPLLRR